MMWTTSTTLEQLNGEKSSTDTLCESNPLDTCGIIGFRV